MLFKDTRIQRKLMMVILLTSGVVLFVTCVSFFAYEFITFRQSTIRQLSAVGEIIANNSTGALAFDSRDDASEMLASLKAEKHIVAAALYDKDGNLFSYYPASLGNNQFPVSPEIDGYRFESSHIIGIQPVIQGSRRLGTLYLKSDMGAMYERFRLYGGITVLVVGVSFLVAYLLSKWLQKGISKPILALAETAKLISSHKDYSVRAIKMGDDELGLLTDSFNHMLIQIKQAEEEIRSLNQMLEQKVTERTNELEAFTYSVSHDLRAPLRSVDGYARILAEDYGPKLDEEGKRVINVITNNAKRMGQLIDDLLDFSRVGRKELTKTSFNINEMVNGVVHELTALENGRKIKINVQHLESARADFSMLRQVWINLIANALKYTRRGNTATIIEIGSYQATDEICYYVKDNGVGFDMQYSNKLFEVFQRLHKQQDFEGTGVGLALVKRIVTRHGGRVWAEGKINAGATFYFALPQAHESE